MAVRSSIPVPGRMAETIATELESRILEGSLSPGDRLPPERELAAELGVSRPPLREAILMLAAKGLVVTRHGVGTTVTDRLQAPIVDSWQEMLDAHPDLQSDMLEMRHLLESHAAALAAERATDLDLKRLDAAMAALEHAYAEEDLSASAILDVDFHRAVAEASHNAMIGQFISSILTMIQGHVADNIMHLHEQPPKWRELRAQHRAILRAIRNRDSAGAARAAQEHVEFVRAAMADAAAAKTRRRVAERRLKAVHTP